MSVDDNVFRSLVDMGIDSQLARAAAARFTHSEAAVNWCFGDGANWSPEQDRIAALSKPTRPVPTPPRPNTALPDYAKAGTTVEHHEVVSHTSEGSVRSPPNVKSPPLPARPQRLPLSPEPVPQPIAFGDKNPFRNSKLETNATTTTGDSSESTSTNPFHQPYIQDLTQPDEDEDEELQRALAMSVDPSTEGEPPSYDDGSPDRERSVRATAPPPSPTEKRGDLVKQENQPSRAQSPYGPREEEAAANSLALMPSSMTDRAPTRTKEEEDMEKAIADSLMTASFHSNASLPPNLHEPEQVPRIGNTPMILYSESGRATATANLLQAVVAIPRLKALAENLQAVPYEDSVMNYIFEIVKREACTDDSFMAVDEVAADIFGKVTNHNELPPLSSVREAWEAILHDAEDRYADASSELQQKWNKAEQPTPAQLFRSELSHLRQSASYVTFFRDADILNIHAGMASALWLNDASNSIKETSDILLVQIGWSPSGKRELWRLDSKIVIDRYMTQNVAWSLNIRAQTGVSQGNVRRQKEKSDRLTTHNGNDIATSLKSVIAHYETTPGKDEMQQEQRREIKEKLEKTLAQLQAKAEELRTEIESETKAAEGGLFETDDPEYNQHIYRLVAVLYHDGALMGQGHLYMYLLGSEDQWWKIQDHKATPVDWSTVASDSTGLYMDGGPYTLVYDRESPRTEPYGAESERQRFATEDREEQPTPRAVPRTQDSTLYSLEGEAQHIERSAVPPQIPLPDIDLLGAELPPFPTQSLPHITSRPLPQVPVHAPTSQPKVEPKKEETTDEDVTMS